MALHGLHSPSPAQRPSPSRPRSEGALAASTRTLHALTALLTCVCAPPSPRGFLPDALRAGRGCRIVHGGGGVWRARAGGTLTSLACAFSPGAASAWCGSAGRRPAGACWQPRSSPTAPRTGRPYCASTRPSRACATRTWPSCRPPISAPGTWSSFWSCALDRSCSPAWRNGEGPPGLDARLWRGREQAVHLLPCLHWQACAGGGSQRRPGQSRALPYVPQGLLLGIRG